MILLISVQHKDLPRVPEVGRLVIPRLMSGVEETAHAGVVWAADCDAFGGFGREQADRFERMVERIAPLPGCRWVTCPDVLGDHGATLDMFSIWAPCLAPIVPVAFVLQNGATPETVPWEHCAAVFIGGDDAFKLGAEAAACVAEARRRGHWVHMGRVNSWRRMRYAAALGCDSIDGTKFSRWRDAHLDTGLGWLRNARDQLFMEGMLDG